MSNKLKQNIIYNAIYQVIVIALPIITMPYIVRRLSPEQIGINSYTLSIVQIFLIFSMFGINNYGSREIAYIKDKNKRSELFWNIWTIQFIFSIISFLCFTIMNKYIFTNSNQIFKLQALLILINMLEVSWFFIGIEELKKVVIRNTAIKLFFTLSIFIFIKSEKDFITYVILNVIGTFIGNLILVNSLRKYLKKPNVKLGEVKNHIKRSWVFLLPQISILVYTTLDKTILGNLSNMTSVAYYDQSQKIVRITIALISSVGISLLPRMSMYIKENKKKEFDELFTKSINNTILLSFYIVTGIICIAPSFVIWFFSEEYKDVILLMQIVAPIGIFIPIATLLWNTILIPMREDKVAVKSAIYAAIISLTLNFILVFKLGAMGAVLTLVFVEFFGMAYRIYYSRSFYNFKRLIPNIVKCIIALIISFIISIWINNIMIPTVITSFITGIIITISYFSILIIFKETTILEYKKGVINMVCKKMWKIKDKMTDKNYITIDYVKRFKKFPNIKAPKTLSEKIHAIKISNWLEDKGEYVDKYRVREYIENKIGNEYLIRLHGVYKNINEINFDNLPKSFVLKLNNGSGYNLIVKDKDKIDIEETKALLTSWLDSNFYKKTREKQYKNVNQLIICEEYLEDDSGELRDYKFFCFNGEAKFVQVDTGRFSSHIQNFYDKEWNKLDFTYVCEKNKIIDKKPKLYEEMISMAEKLSKEFPFVRVDFYYVNNKIYFGELTFTPNNGMQNISPKEKDLEIASWIDISKYTI